MGRRTALGGWRWISAETRFCWRIAPRSICLDHLVEPLGLDPYGLGIKVDANREVDWGEVVWGEVDWGIDQVELDRIEKSQAETGGPPVSPRPRFDSLASERQLAILQAAAAEFAERGFDSASYNRIIQLSGVSKGAMYYYFDDKRDLYLTVLRDAEQRATDTIGPLAEFDDANSFWDALADLYLRITGFVADEPLAAGLIKSAYGGGPVTDSAYGEFIERLSKQFEAVLAEGIRLGAVRSDLPLDLLLAVTLATGEATDRWALQNLDRLTELGPGGLAEIAEQLLEMHFRLIAPLALVSGREVGRRKE